MFENLLYVNQYLKKFDLLKCSNFIHMQIKCRKFFSFAFAFAFDHLKKKVSHLTNISLTMPLLALSSQKKKNKVP